MRVVVSILPEARDELVSLLEARLSTTRDAVAFAWEFCQDIEEQFVKYDGFPPTARRVTAADGSDWWWKYVNGIWVVYRATDTRRWRFGTITRSVTVFAFEPAPPTA